MQSDELFNLVQKELISILDFSRIECVISLSTSRRTSIICSGKIYGLFLSQAFFSVSWKISAAFSEKGKLINTRTLKLFMIYMVTKQMFYKF